MDNFTIRRFCDQHPVLNKRFIGCFTSNNLPKQLFPMTCMLVNHSSTEIHQSNGYLHWIAITIDAYGNADCFDAFNLPLPRIIKLWLPKNCNFNKTRLVSLTSKKCAIFSLWYCIHKMRHPNDNMQKILKHFPNENLLTLKNI
jgi:hypothetical protein